MKHPAPWTIGFVVLLFVFLFHVANTPAVESAQVEPSGLSGAVTANGTGLEGVAASGRHDESRRPKVECHFARG